MRHKVAVPICVGRRSDAQHDDKRSAGVKISQAQDGGSGTRVDALDLEEKQLGAELVAWLLAKGREKLSLLVESEGKAYRISIEPDKKVPVLHERW